MDNLTPTAQATLAALRDGPGNVHELRERTGRSRSATDKAIGELAKANLIVKVDGGDVADGAPTRWQLADPTPADGESSKVDDDSGDQVTAMPDKQADGQPDAEQATTDEVSDPATPDEADGEPDSAPHESEATAGVDPGQNAADDAEPSDEADGGEVDRGEASRGEAGAEQHQAGDSEQATVADEPKICRGCQAQLPKICPHCWQKTPAYCGDCRKKMPQVRRGEPGEPQILSNGLPKLRPGELEQLVLKVMQDHPLPHHVGITGWTSNRVVIYLPGRSTGAIGNALDKLTQTGQAELIGDKPMRYQLKPTEQPDAKETKAESTDQAGVAGEVTATTE